MLCPTCFQPAKAENTKTTKNNAKIKPVIINIYISIGYHVKAFYKAIIKHQVVKKHDTYFTGSLLIFRNKSLASFLPSKSSFDSSVALSSKAASLVRFCPARLTAR